jgi:hypothetical protein
VTVTIAIAHPVGHATHWRLGRVGSGSCHDRMSFVPPDRSRSRPFGPAGVRAHAAGTGQVIDAHGEQNGAIYQQVPLGRSDFAPVSLLAEDRADVLECCINGKHGDHSSHLHRMLTARDARPGQGLRSSLGQPPVLVSLAVRAYALSAADHVAAQRSMTRVWMLALGVRMRRFGPSRRLEAIGCVLAVFNSVWFTGRRAVAEPETVMTVLSTARAPVRVRR